jgi:hypothetical protein
MPLVLYTFALYRRRLSKIFIGPYLKEKQAKACLFAICRRFFGSCKTFGISNYAGNISDRENL